MTWHERRGLPAPEEPLMLLDLPDLRQQTDYDCGSVAVDVVARFHGLRARRPAKFSNPIQGATPDLVEATLRALGCAVASGSLTVDDLRHFTRTGRPVLCVIQYDGSGHWVAARGVERGRVHVQCPTRGRVAIPSAEWRDGWHDRHFLGGVYDRWGIVCGK